MTPPRLLLVPSFTELEWGIRDQLEEWAEVASFDMPGVGGESLTTDLAIDAGRPDESLSRWRDEGVARGLAEVGARGWERFVVASDGHGAPTAVRLALARRASVLGLAIGHASLSSATDGDRPPVRRGVWDALAQLSSQGNEAFVRHGIAQMTRGGISEEVAEQMLERFPDMELVRAMVEAIGQVDDPIGDDLADLDVRLLLGKHEGCLGFTDEGFEDIVTTFPSARTVICPEACTASPAFAEALERFCAELSRGT